MSQTVTSEGVESASVAHWTGIEVRIFRQAMRQSIRACAAGLGVSDRSLSKWEAEGAAAMLRPDSQSILDTALARAGKDVQARFALALRDHHAAGPAFAPARGAAEQLVVDSHKFVPVWIGAENAARLRDQMSPAPGAWLDRSSTSVNRTEPEHDLCRTDAVTCTLHVYACGVAVFHLVQPLTAASLTDVALWRYRTYSHDLPWARARLAEALAVPVQAAPEPQYVLSVYWLHSGPPDETHLDVSVRLLSTPSVLVDRTATEVRPLDHGIEESLLADGFDHPDLVSFGVRGVAIGYAGWSGVAYHSQAPERALPPDALLDLERDVQALWAFCENIQTHIEDGRDPPVSPDYGWRFLRAAHSRLTTPRPRETAQHLLMRDAVLTTSGLTARLRAAQTALREQARP